MKAMKRLKAALAAPAQMAAQKERERLAQLELDNAAEHAAQELWCTTNPVSAGRIPLVDYVPPSGGKKRPSPVRVATIDLGHFNVVSPKPSFFRMKVTFSNGAVQYANTLPMAVRQMKKALPKQTVVTVS